MGCVGVYDETLVILPERVGKRAMDGCRHFVPALLERRLLCESVPADRIAALVAGGAEAAAPAAAG